MTNSSMRKIVKIQSLSLSFSWLYHIFGLRVSLLLYPIALIPECRPKIEYTVYSII